MRTTVIFIVLFFAALQLRAQDTLPRWFLGVVGGYNANYHSGSIYDGCSCRVTPSKGTGNGVILGIAAERWFDSEGTTSLQLKAYYEQKPGKFTVDGNYLEYFDTVSNTITTYRTNVISDAQYDLFNVELLYKYNAPFLPHAGASIGPIFGFVTSSSYSNYESYPPPFTYTDGTSTHYFVTPGNIPGVRVFHLSLKLSLQYELHVAPFLITPAIFYDIGVTSIASEWNVNTLAGTIDVKYGL